MLQTKKGLEESKPLIYFATGRFELQYGGQILILNSLNRR